MKPCYAVFASLVAIALPTAVWPQGQGAYRLAFSTMAASGAPVTGAAFRLNGTLGQPSPPGAQATDDFILHAGLWRALISPTTDVDPPPAAPAITEVRQNFPNPFRGSTTVRFALATTQVVDIAVFDLAGRRVTTLSRGPREPGEYAVTWTGSRDQGGPATPGVYLCRFRAGSYGAVRKMVLVK